ncbi:MAG TPA: hypothetical protein VN047_09040 [Sphingopyxis sp.]|nr:hypothetical protein [Sphingopyxis sp.]
MVTEPTETTLSSSASDFRPRATLFSALTDALSPMAVLSFPKMTALAPTAVLLLPLAKLKAPHSVEPSISSGVPATPSGPGLSLVLHSGVESAHAGTGSNAIAKMIAAALLPRNSFGTLIMMHSSKVEGGMPPCNFSL